VGKVYFQHGLDERNRFEAEFEGLTFLWDSGIRSVPRPVAGAKRDGVAVYEYVEGRRLDSSEICDAHIDLAVAFLSTLKSLSALPGATKLPVASEAAFSMKAILSIIRARLARLSSIEQSASEYKDLKRFLKCNLSKALEQIESRRASLMVVWTRPWDGELMAKYRTLSPSDFGFHNALRRDDGSLVFLDFEYFGWDDPAKTISDFLLHPAMDLNDSLRSRFFSQVLEGFANDSDLARRVELVYPLFGLKWCLILLNEFVPEHMTRRNFSLGRQTDIRGVRIAQLTKSRIMLQKVMAEYEDFFARVRAG